MSAAERPSLRLELTVLSGIAEFERSPDSAKD
jgi:hypothetical protein